MTRTLFEVTLRVHESLGGLVFGRATSGSSDTQVEDTNLLQSRFKDDHFNLNGLGTMWLVHDAGGASAAPEGEFARVSDFVSSTGIASLVETLTAAIATGDRYALATPRYSLDLLINKVNAALDYMGPMVVTDTTSLDTAENKKEYTLPTANMDLREVWVQTNTNDSDDNSWVMIKDWYVQETTTGSADTLVFYRQPQANRDIKLVYLGVHPYVWDATDQISEQVPFELLVAETRYRVLLDMLGDVGRTNAPNLDDQIREAQAQLALLRSSWKKRIPAKKAQVVTILN